MCTHALSIGLGLILSSCLHASDGAGAGSFTSEWQRDHDRIWLGPDYHANRWQDWRIRNGRVECVEVGKRLPMRTVQVLTSILEPENGSIELSVRTGPIDWDAEPGENSWSGLSIGAGGPDIDHRRTALVHHMPAPDGGILVLVDPMGIVTIRDNEKSVGKTPTWSISRNITTDELDALQPQSRTGAGSRIGGDGVVLQTRITADSEGTYTLQATVSDAEETTVISTATTTGLFLDKVQGGFGIVSHHGPDDSPFGWWFSRLAASGTGVVEIPNRKFGPILGTLYTVDDDVLKLTAQFPPLGEEDSWTTSLQVQETPGAYWKTVATERIDPDSRTATFRVENWPETRETPYRVVYSVIRNDGTQVASEYHGIIRAEPSLAEPLVLGSLTCHKTYTGGLKWNSDGLWFPHEELVGAVTRQDPDLLYFSGDQIYEGDLTPAGQRGEDAYILDYLWKYTHWLWAFRDLTRDRPTIVIPDDHDVYHGNIWGAGGRRARKQGSMSAQDSGGYKHSPRMVNAVHRSQTAHLPDPIDDTPIGEGYSVYYTDFEYAGVSFAIISDRQFKESPTIAVPEGKVTNGWFTAEGFDPAVDGDAPDADLLGEAQERFLESWITEWEHDTWMKVLLSQTPFACVQTLPRGKRGGGQPGLTIFEEGGYAADDVPSQDADSNGWPQTARNRALKIIQPGQVLHLCGDQHLAFVAQYGVDQYRDGGVVFCSPAIANTWPRRWMPRTEGEPRQLGDHLDGFGNRVSVDAVANPLRRGFEPAGLHDRSPGFGIVRFNAQDGTVELEAWPRAAGLVDGAGQYEGWPLELPVSKLTGRNWPFELVLDLEQLDRTRRGQVFQIRSSDSGALIRTGRFIDDQPDLWRVPAAGQYVLSWFSDSGDVSGTTEHVTQQKDATE
jgi:alkaline phosphatase D